MEENFNISKKKKLMEDFSKMKVLLAHQLDQQYPRDFAHRVFEKAKKEFEKTIPELPYVNLKSYNEDPYIRLMIFSSMSMAIYYALVKMLKSKKVARQITFTFFQMNLPGSYSVPVNMLAKWMFSRFEYWQYKKKLKRKFKEDETVDIEQLTVKG